MRVKLAACLGMLGTLAGMNCLGQGEKAGKAAPVSASKLERMPESLEIRFALSAAPPHLRDSATTYVLDPAKGYVLSHKGTNGISCIVVRSDWQFPNQPFRDDIFWPVCYDAEGSRNLLQDYIHAAELRARGMNAKEVHQEVTKQFGTADSPNPSRTGVAYMIAPVMRGFDCARGRSREDKNSPGVEWPTFRTLFLSRLSVYNSRNARPYTHRLAPG